MKKIFIFILHNNSFLINYKSSSTIIIELLILNWNNFKKKNTEIFTETMNATRDSGFSESIVIDVESNVESINSNGEKTEKFGNSGCFFFYNIIYTVCMFLNLISKLASVLLYLNTK